MSVALNLLLLSKVFSNLLLLQDNMMKLSLACLLLLSAVAGPKILEFIFNFRILRSVYFLGIQGMNVETTPARQVCESFECPNEAEEGGLFQVFIIHIISSFFPFILVLRTISYFNFRSIPFSFSQHHAAQNSVTAASVI